MTSEREPVDDAALIVEAIKNTGKSMSCWRDEIELVAREAVRLARTGWQPPAPEPDRAELLAKELWENGSGPSLKDWETIIRRHLSELRAEWEAERPVIDVPKDVVLWAHAQKDAKTGNAYVADFILQLARQSQ